MKSNRHNPDPFDVSLYLLTKIVVFKQLEYNICPNFPKRKKEKTIALMMQTIAEQHFAEKVE